MPGIGIDITPGFDPDDAKKKAKKAVRKITKPVRRVGTATKRELGKADRAIFGGKGIRDNLKKLKAELDRAKQNK